MQLLKVKDLKLPTLPEFLSVSKTLQPQLTKQKKLYCADQPPCKHEEISECLTLVAKHLTLSQKKPEKYSKNTLYFLWMLLCDEHRQEFYDIESNTFSRYFTQGDKKLKDDSNSQLLTFLASFYENFKLQPKQKACLNMLIKGFNSTEIANTLKIERPDVTKIIKELTSKALPHLKAYVENCVDNINSDIEELHSLIWDEET
jgi:hypothetical protein